VIAKYGKPDVMWTEFVSTEALTRVTDPIARQKILVDLKVLTPTPTTTITIAN